MIGLTGRLPDGEFRDAIIAMLIREAALAQDRGTFPADLIATIAQLEADTTNRPGTGLRIDPGDDAQLRAALEQKAPDLAEYQQLVTRVQRGTAPMADIGSLVEPALRDRPAPPPRWDPARRRRRARHSGPPGRTPPGRQSRPAPAPRTCPRCTCSACSQTTTGSASARPCPHRRDRLPLRRQRRPPDPRPRAEPVGRHLHRLAGTRRDHRPHHPHRRGEGAAASPGPKPSRPRRPPRRHASWPRQPAPRPTRSPSPRTASFPSGATTSPCGRRPARQASPRSACST